MHDSPRDEIAALLDIIAGDDVQEQQEEPESHNGPIEDDSEQRQSKRKFLLDDVPMAIKRTKYQDNPTGIQRLPMIAMNAFVHQTNAQWFSAG